MGKIAVDIAIEIEFAMKMTPERVTIKTNAKPECVADLIEEYLMGVAMGSGHDDSPADERDVYTIKLGLALDGDRWGLEHDCGNKGLCTGILMRVVAILSTKNSVVFKEL